MCSLLDFETVNRLFLLVRSQFRYFLSFFINSKRVQSSPAPFLPDICVPVSVFVNTIDARAIWDLIDANRKKKAKNAHSLDMKN